MPARASNFSEAMSVRSARRPRRSGRQRPSGARGRSGHRSGSASTLTSEIEPPKAPGRLPVPAWFARSARLPGVSEGERWDSPGPASSARRSRRRSRSSPCPATASLVDQPQRVADPAAGYTPSSRRSCRSCSRPAACFIARRWSMPQTSNSPPRNRTVIASCASAAYAGSSSIPA